jgi:hypothetical protein
MCTPWEKRCACEIMLQFRAIISISPVPVSDFNRVAHECENPHLYMTPEDVALMEERESALHQGMLIFYLPIY